MAHNKRNAAVMMAAIGLAALVPAAPAAADIKAAAAYCVEVIAKDVKVFKSRNGDAYYGQWKRGTVFVATGRKGVYDRHKTYWQESYDAWVTSNPKWTRVLPSCSARAQQDIR